jgi:hypothetical protein
MVFLPAGLSVALAVMGVRSFFRCDRLYVPIAGVQWKVESLGAHVSVERFGGWPGGPEWGFQALPVDPRRGLTPLVSYGPSSVRGYERVLLRADGTARVTLSPVGSVDWGSPVAPQFSARPSPGAVVSFSAVVVQSWWVALLLAFPLVCRVSLVLRRRMAGRSRRLRGLCPACGYDVRASPSRCPECGAVVVATGGSAGGVN